MITARGPGLPTLGLAVGRRTDIVSIEFIETGTPQSQLLGGNGGAEFFPPEGRQNLTD
jgi:hypothetical protein